MSRRRSNSSTMGPPTDRDGPMGPPSSSAPQPKPKDNHEINEKYRKLKRRFFELEEKHKETSTELQRSGERNVKMREERNILLDRIIELESEQPFQNGRSSASPPSLQPNSSAFPRTLLNARTRTSHVANPRHANAEDDADDDFDPIPTSRCLGPEARRRGEDEPMERHVEDSRNGGRRSRGSLPNSGSSHQGSPSPDHNSPTLPSTSISGRRASAERVTSPGAHNATASSSSSSSRGHLRHSPLPSNQSHSPLYAHQPPQYNEQARMSPSHHYSHPHQHFRSPDRGEYGHSSPKEAMDVSMDDDRGYDPSSRPDDMHSLRRDGSPNRDSGGSDPKTHEQNGLQNALSPGVGDAESGPSTSRSTEPASGPSRTTRRSTRVSVASHDRESEHDPAPRTRGAAKRKASSPPAVKVRVTRKESAALAAAAAAAKAEEAEAIKECSPQPSSVVVRDPTSPPTAYQPSPPTPLSAPSPLSPPPPPDIQEKQYASTSTSPVPQSRQISPSQNPTSTVMANSSRHSSAAAASPAPGPDPNIDPNLAGTRFESAETGSAKESSPMESIVKVAEAAIAAQNAAKSATSSTSASPAPSQTQPPVTARSNGSGTSTSPTSYNPYMITTQMVPGKINTMGMASPPGMMPLSMNPYAMYYAPGTPITPGTPTYPHPYNPYYYLTGPMPGPNGMYPANPNFVPPSSQRPPSEVQRHAKPKRLKAHTVTSKSFSIPMVPRDKRGKPMLPLNVGIMTVISLGDVCMREHFHTERYIFPVGYEVTRRYLSTVDPNIEVVYHCTILDGGDGPKFQIVPSDVPDRPVIAGTATGAWSSIVKQANAIRNRQHSNSVSGPDFFGLGQNTIKHLIQELPNADRLRDYVWQTFVEGGPLGGRHAAVIPALPEEYDASMPIGAYYPTDRDKMRRTSGTPDTPSPKGISHYPQHIIAQAEAQRAQQQALQQAQQIGAQPLKPGEGSGLQQLKGANQPPGQQSLAAMGFQEYRPQLATSADRTPSGPGASAAPSSYVPDGGPPPAAAGTTSVPATFASIMNAYPTTSGPPPPAQ
ncbi:hypothetical protein D9615_006687 [Tricholomella constricta]|uniref:Transforming growth factor beta regulator 1 n=1 Tax=Tricholomella constricta TaxID=117010 RepID=A0A8H5H6Z9_9AGAR|nr:hypothetical protein D9615_006687 [Tricholomella constricta]